MDYYISFPSLGDVPVRKEVFEKLIEDLESEYQIVKLNSVRDPGTLYHYAWSINNDWQYIGYSMR